MNAPARRSIAWGRMFAGSLVGLALVTLLPAGWRNRSSRTGPPAHGTRPARANTRAIEVIVHDPATGTEKLKRDSDGDGFLDLEYRLDARGIATGIRRIRERAPSE